MAMIHHDAMNVVLSDDGAHSESSTIPVSSDLRFQPVCELRSLKQEVTELIQPWRNESNHRPPFTAGELIAIMLVLGNQKPRSYSDIHFDILSTFSYYGKAAWEAASFHLSFQPRNPHTIWEGRHRVIVDGFNEALEDFELPLTSIMCEHSELEISEERYTISGAAARVYLRHRLEPSRQGVFDFMGLPAELREKILEMLLVFPKPAITVADSASGASTQRLGLLSREDQLDPAPEKLSKYLQTQIMVEPLEKTLAIARVSKQVRREALPVFYGRNAFIFASLPLFRWAGVKMTSESFSQTQDLRVVMDGHFHLGWGLLRYLSLKNLVLAVPKNSTYWYFCSEGLDDELGSPTESQLAKLDTIAELWDIVAMAKRAKCCEIQGPGFLGAWLREKVGSAGGIPKSTRKNNRKR